MDYGALNAYFEGVALKELKAVDIDAKVSNQHELNGVAELKEILGTERLKELPTTFIYLEDYRDAIFDDGFVTWYDSRANNPKRSEYRLYYSENLAVAHARPGDLGVVAVTESKKLLIVFVKHNSTKESQLKWLFGISGNRAATTFIQSSIDELGRIDALGASILESMGIEVIPSISAQSYLDEMIDMFGDHFPKGSTFTNYSISTLGKLDWVNSPDACLTDCYEREELLFRVFERYLLENTLNQYVGNNFDVDGILRVTMSAFQRRKSRAGMAFENQLSHMFDALGIMYSPQSYTENKSKPDFIFPSIDAYHDDNFPSDKLTMLGAKTTIKERWRQVLQEADRITVKHLITLEPAISEEYTAEMAKNNLRLVVPSQLFTTYSSVQQDWLMSVAEFCEIVKNKQL